LYRVDFDSFEAYCREKWQYGRDYVDRMISAAQLFTYLLTNCQHRKPDHESQLRPLIGLSPAEALSVWDRVVEKAGDHKITARSVKAAVVELGFKPPPATEKPTDAKSQHRQRVADAIQELLTLIRQNENHRLLLEKAQILEWRLNELLH
jgi:hypothetical protein